jgi:Lrp/AsnC family leucine-responsive transcriptional regulator
MPHTRNLDGIDRRIVKILQANARTSQVDIARAVKLAPSAVLERIRKLERRAVITGYAALVDPHYLEHTMLAFVAVRTADMPGEARVGRALARIPEVLEVHHVAGEDCLMLKVRARNPEHLGELLRRRFGRIRGLRSTRTTIVLDSVKDDPRIPVPPAPPAASDASQP